MTEENDYVAGDPYRENDHPASTWRMHVRRRGEPGNKKAFCIVRGDTADECRERSLVVLSALNSEYVTAQRDEKTKLAAAMAAYDDPALLAEVGNVLDVVLSVCDLVFIKSLDQLSVPDISTVLRDLKMMEPSIRGARDKIVAALRKAAS